MKVLTVVLILCISTCSNGQFGGFRGFRGFFNGGVNVFRPVTQMFHHMPTFSMPSFRMPRFFGGAQQNTINTANSAEKGTKEPIATGEDKLYPDDCGRGEDKKGLLCFPDGLLCQNRLNNGGIERYGNHNYLFTWLSNDARVRNAKWDWFNARNYCRKRCMDLVSLETADEYEWIKGKMGGVKYIWTSGRLCNFDGCDRPDFFPKSINGWFWSANQARLNPTNGTRFQDWSFTGGFNPPRRQPDNREQVQQNGEEEACLAVLNNFYGDGIKWHDVACHHEKPIVCEDTEGHLNFARQTFPNIRIP